MALIATLLWLLIAAAAGLIAGLALGWISFAALTASIPHSEALLQFTQQHSGANQFVLVICASTIALVSLWMALRSLFGTTAKNPERHLLSVEDHGVVMVESRSISAIVMHAVRRISGILEARVALSRGGTDPLRIRVDAQVYPGTDLTRVGQAVREAAYDSVDELVGVPIESVRVHMHVVDSKKLGSLLS